MAVSQKKAKESAEKSGKRPDGAAIAHPSADVKLTAQPWEIEKEDRERLRQAGFTDRDIWDISAVAGFFNMSNRVASATDMRPNPVYHRQAR